MKKQTSTATRRWIGAALVLVAASPALAATLLVASRSQDTVDLIDVATGRSRAQLAVGRAPAEIAVSPDGKIAAVSNHGGQDSPGSSLTIIDVVLGKVLRTVDLGEHTRPHGLAWLSNDRLAVTAEGIAHLLVVDPGQARTAQRIETAQRASHMVALEPGGRRAFVANVGSSSVSVIDLVEGTKLRDVRIGAGPEGIAVAPAGREVWIANRGADTLAVLDTSRLEIAATLPCAGFPIRLAFTPDGQRVLVTCARSGEIALFDAASRQELRRRKLDVAVAGEHDPRGPEPAGLVVAPNGKTAWVAATRASAVAVVDATTLAQRGIVRTSPAPAGIAFSSLGPRVKRAVKRAGT